MNRSNRRQTQGSRRGNGMRIKKGLSLLTDLDAVPAPAPAKEPSASVEKPERARPQLKRPREDEPRATSSGKRDRGDNNTTARGPAADESLSSPLTPAVPPPPYALHSGSPVALQCVQPSVFGAGWSEWWRVREVLFSPTALPAEKRAALRCMGLWRARRRLRRPLPNYIEATTLLAEAVLADEEDATPARSLAQAYGAALARTVHVVTGSHAVGAQDTYRKRAQAIGFPEEVVEARQRVAHGDLPPLTELRWAAALALQFLFHHYWIPQEHELAAAGLTAATASPTAGADATADAPPARRQRREGDADDRARQTSTARTASQTKTGKTSRPAANAVAGGADTTTKSPAEKPSRKFSIKEMKDLLSAVESSDSE